MFKHKSPPKIAKPVHMSFNLLYHLFGRLGLAVVINKLPFRVDEVDDNGVIYDVVVVRIWRG